MGAGQRDQPMKEKDYLEKQGDIFIELDGYVAEACTCICVCMFVYSIHVDFLHKGQKSGPGLGPGQLSWSAQT